jgi:hypothetical protein
MGKILIITGIIIVVIGILIHFYPGNGLLRLPGDIYIKQENYSFYFPLGWSVLISVVLSLALWYLSK